MFSSVLNIVIVKITMMALEQKQALHIKKIHLFRVPINLSSGISATFVLLRKGLLLSVFGYERLFRDWKTFPFLFGCW